MSPPIKNKWHIYKRPLEPPCKSLHLKRPLLFKSKLTCNGDLKLSQDKLDFIYISRNIQHASINGHANMSITDRLWDHMKGHQLKFQYEVYLPSFTIFKVRFPIHARVITYRDLFKYGTVHEYHSCKCPFGLIQINLDKYVHYLMKIVIRTGIFKWRCSQLFNKLKSWKGISFGTRKGLFA